jgi:hypothetical protein
MMIRAEGWVTAALEPPPAAQQHVTKYRQYRGAPGDSTITHHQHTPPQMTAESFLHKLDADDNVPWFAQKIWWVP